MDDTRVRSRWRHGVIILVVIAGGLLATTHAGTARAGGSPLYPDRDRYEPEERATMVGYVGRGALGWVGDGPFYAYLRVTPHAVEATRSEQWPFIHPTDVLLGQLAIEQAGHDGYEVLRVSITFTVPAGLARGEFDIVYCNDPCTEGLGDLVGGRVSLSVDPSFPVVRGWPLDDPAVPQLSDDALLWGPGFPISAAQVRSGGYDEPDPAVVARFTEDERAALFPGPPAPVRDDPVPPADRGAARSRVSVTDAEAVAADPIASHADGQVGWPLLIGACGVIALVTLALLDARRTTHGRRR